MGNCHPRRTRGASGTCRNCFRSVWGCQGIKMCSYAQAPGVLNGHRQVRIDLKQDIPSFLFIAGHKAHVLPGQPRTCFRCGETGHEAKGCPNKSVGAAFVLGMIPLLAQAKLCAHSVGRRACFSRCPSSYVFMTKSGGQSKAKFCAPTASEEAPRKGGDRMHLVHPPPSCRPQPRARTEKVSTSFPYQLVQFRPQSAAGIARSGDSVDGDSGTRWSSVSGGSV
ncbi:putative zinc finger CCHC domain-containing protein 3-like [Apostichopus japonicus]|uniref:Putative zinc finger CCHC domain-containing protein 3-like n=1 Tax=Stichopus japonicus TaxID=307972 RepID=A0A2G8KGB0_STIJA|nr:putative zinc finger CCHC domain-containing protein 3-like [Apostichopus japonicus]